MKRYIKLLASGVVSIGLVKKTAKAKMTQRLSQLFFQKKGKNFGKYEECKNGSSVMAVSHDFQNQHTDLPWFRSNEMPKNFDQKIVFAHLLRVHDRTHDRKGAEITANKYSSELLYREYWRIAIRSVKEDYLKNYVRGAVSSAGKVRGKQ